MSNQNTSACARFFAAVLLLALAGCGGGGGGGGGSGGAAGGTTGATGGGGGTTSCGAFAVPSAPTIYNTVPGNGSMQVWFSMSVSSGAPVTSYIVTAAPPTGSSVTATVPATTASTYVANVSGLANGITYTFSVVGINCLGASLPSNLVAATPATVPNAPTIGAATPGNAQATVNFTPPTSDGGSAILYYTATSNPGGIQVQGTASPITVTGLTNGTS